MTSPIMAGAIRRKNRDGKPSRRWTAIYTDEDGQTRMRGRFTDRRETLALAKKLEDDAKARRLAARQGGPDQAFRHAEGVGGLPDGEQAWGLGRGLMNPPLRLAAFRLTLQLGLHSLQRNEPPATSPNRWDATGSGFGE